MDDPTRESAVAIFRELRLLTLTVSSLCALSKMSSYPGHELPLVEQFAHPGRFWSHYPLAAQRKPNRTQCCDTP